MKNNFYELILKKIKENITDLSFVFVIKYLFDFDIKIIVLLD